MIGFLLVVVLGWIFISLAVGVYNAVQARKTREQVVESVIHVLTLPYQVVRMLIQMYKK